MFIINTGKYYRSLSLLDTDHTYLFLAQVTGPRLKLIRTASIESIEAVLCCGLHVCALNSVHLLRVFCVVLRVYTVYLL